MTMYIRAFRSRQIRPIVVDPGLYLSSRNDIFYATQKRDLPNAYKLFTGKEVFFIFNLPCSLLGTKRLGCWKWKSALQLHCKVKHRVNYHTLFLCLLVKVHLGSCVSFGWLMTNN
jgi:hypothetical protein